MMPISFRSFVFVLGCIVAAYSGTAWAQGSAGGSIGNDDKSVSGSRPEPRSVEPSRPARRASKPESDAPQRSSRRSGGSAGGVGSGGFDGAWSYVGVGTNCQGSGSGTFTVHGGRVSLAGGGGSVSPSGAFHSSATGADGVSLTATGRLSGNAGGGTYMRADGCGGRWTANRQ